MRISDWSSDVCSSDLVWHSLRFSAVQIVRVWPPHDHDGSAAPAPDDDVAPPPPLEPAPAINKSLTNLKAQRVIAEFTRRREAGELPEDLGRHGTLKLGRASCRERGCQ